MRIALHATSELGDRARKILSAEPDLTALGLYGHPGAAEDRRTMVIDELDGFQVLATDDPLPTGLATIAATDGVSFVASSELRLDDELADRFRVAEATVVGGVDLEAVAVGLASHEAGRTDGRAEITIAWTTPGSGMRSGEAVPFPDPVGARWGRRLAPGVVAGIPVQRLEVPLAGPWAGAVAMTRGDGDRLVGVADDRAHLGAISLAAAAITVAEGGFEPGDVAIGDRADRYLATALRIGLGVAAFSSDA